MAPAPIILGPSMAGEPNDSGSVLPYVVHASPNSSPKLYGKRTAAEHLAPVAKRPQTAIGYDNPRGTPNVTPNSAFHSLRLTKPMSRTPSTDSTEKGDTTHLLAWTSNRGGSVLTDSSDWADMPCMWQMTSDSDAECETACESTINAVHSAHVGVDQSDLSDAYPLGDGLVDDDIVHLLADASNAVQENHIPPSSALEWNYGSQSGTEYGPTLKHSPPNLQEPDRTTSTTKPRLTPTAKDIDISEDLLDEDVDWDAVLTDTNMIQKDSSPDSYPEIDAPRSLIMETCASRSNDVGRHSDEAEPGSLTAFVRPPYPDKIRDRPSVPGMSSDTLLRTCFRIGAMISQTARCFNYQQDVMFELYARVTYSNRESLARKQHFQFVDLFKDQHPYPAATLTNWRVDSQMDKDSQTFLDTSGGPRLCWCMCKPVRDPKAAIGWTYTVLSIKEIDWEQIRWAKRYICGDSEDDLLEATGPELS